MQDNKLTCIFPWEDKELDFECETIPEAKQSIEDIDLPAFILSENAEIIAGYLQGNWISYH